MDSTELGNPPIQFQVVLSPPFVQLLGGGCTSFQSKSGDFGGLFHGKPMVNSPLIRPYFLGGWHWGGCFLGWIHSLKLTVRPYKWMVGMTFAFPIGFRPIFRGFCC